MKTSNVATICVTLVVAGVLFWPTLYRYETVAMGPSSQLLRINRLTGSTERFSGSAWKPEPPRRQLSLIPKDELGKLEGSAQLGYGTFSGKIYNGSSWTVKKVQFLVVAKGPRGRVLWRRPLTTDMQIDPLDTGSFFILTN